MKTLYLHIGTPKTGTTYIQNVLSNNNEVLNKYGYTFPIFDIAIPDASPLRNAHFLIPKLYDENNKRMFDVEAEIYNNGMSKLSECFNQYDNIILSDEMLWVRNQLDMEKFSNDLRQMNINIKVIVYLRRQDLFIQSYWSQLVKMHLKHALLTYIRLNKYSNIHLDYYDRLSEYADIFGKENIVVRVYEKEQYKGRYNTLLSDFLETVGLGQIDEEKEFKEFLNPTYHAKNPSLSDIYLEIKRYFNFNPAFINKNNYVIPILYDIMEEDIGLNGFENSVYMTYAEQMDLLGKFIEGNSKISAEYLGRTDGVLFENMPVDTGVEAAVYAKKDLVYTCSRIVERIHDDSVENIRKKNSEIEKLNDKIEKLNLKIEKQQSKIDWMSASFPTKVKRKLKRVILKK